MVAAWMSAETGVGPSMASGSQRYSGSCALLPVAPISSNNAIAEAVDAMEDDDTVSAIVVTGSDRAFAAGADIKEIKDKSFIDVFSGQFITKDWERIASARKPTICAARRR